jgi:hypothetical protein
MESLSKLFNEIQKDQEGMFATFPKLLHKNNIDLVGFSKQESDYDGIDFEYVNQSGCADYGFHGSMAVPFGDYFILFTYSE